MATIRSFVIRCILGIVVLVGFLIGSVVGGETSKGREGGTDVQQG